MQHLQILCHEKALWGEIVTELFNLRWQVLYMNTSSACSLDMKYDWRSERSNNCRIRFPTHIWILSSNNWNPRSANFYTTQGVPAELARWRSPPRPPSQERKQVSAQLLWLMKNEACVCNSRYWVNYNIRQELYWQTKHRKRTRQWHKFHKTYNWICGTKLNRSKQWWKWINVKHSM